MAGEVQGSIFESIVRVALEQAIAKNKYGWKVLFHQQPSWISIEPDIAIGKDKDSIEVLLLVTHTISEKMSEKKFWRNAAELFQWKVQGPKPVRVLDVLFASKFKPELKKVSEAIMDGVLDLGLTVHGKFLIGYVKEHMKSFGATDDARYQKVKELCDADCEKYDKSFATALINVGNDLKVLLTKDNVMLLKLWELERKIDKEKRPYPKSKISIVRNGIAKLMLLEPGLRALVYSQILQGADIPFDAVPKYALSLGLIVENADTASVQDPDVHSVVKLLKADQCEAVLARVPPRMAQYISILRAPENNQLACKFVVKEFDRLSTPEGMQKALMRCYSDPRELLAEAGKVAREPVEHWLFVYCMTIEKVRAGRVVAYGYSNLAEETGIPEIGSLGGVLISPFINREKPLKPEILKAVSKVFSAKVKELGKEGLVGQQFQKVMGEMLIQRQMYTLSVYRFFDPIGDLIKFALEEKGIPWQEKMIPTCLREFADAKAAKTKYLTVDDDILIFSQSCHGSHVNDKTKELSARFRATKVEWDGEKFKQRSSADKIFFVADGDWRNEDLEMLSRSGASEIYFPDGVKKMAEKIKALRKS
jgi:hypothetical protein